MEETHKMVFPLAYMSKTMLMEKDTPVKWEIRKAAGRQAVRNFGEYEEWRKTND